MQAGAWREPACWRSKQTAPATAIGIRNPAAVGRVGSCLLSLRNWVQVPHANTAFHVLPGYCI